MTTAPSDLTGHLYRSLTLSERSVSLRTCDASWVQQHSDASRAADALRQWKAQPPFTIGDFFAKHLQAEGLKEEELLAILGLPAEAYSEFVHSPPQWMIDLHRIYDGECSIEKGHPQLLEWMKNGANGFLWIAEPLIQEGLRRFREALPAIHNTAGLFEPTGIERLVLPSLLSALKPAVEKAMVLELNIARLRGQLRGELPKDRFRCFCESLRDAGVRSSMVREYPVLFRSLYVRTTNWVTCTIELLHRLCRDWDLIRPTLLPDEGPRTLTAISTGAGDQHRRGRTVAILEFSSGQKLVYKPRSMTLDVHFGEFLEWVNRSGFEPRFRSPMVIDCGEYGWSEYVVHKPCTSHDQVERFYQRLGGYLAIFYSLRANDMHCENLIAAGEFPIPVDLETLFHPVVKQEDDPAFNEWQSSVLRVGLLPMRVLASETQDGVDISGLGGRRNQYYPAGTVESWEASGTDGMRLVRNKAVPVTAGENRPKLNTEDVCLDDFVESFVGGFTRVYRLLESHRSELEAAGSILDRFAADEVRFLARPTISYDTLLSKSFHPDMLRNAIARDRLFGYLWIAATGLPRMKRLIPAESLDLHSGDIPAFTARPSSLDLWTSTGQRVPGFVEQTALDAVRKGLRRLGDEDLALQSWYIRAAIASGTDSMEAAIPRLFLPDSRDCMDLAAAVGDVICKQALEYDSYASWIGLSPMGAHEKSWRLEPLDLCLYGGISGCSFFLAYLGALTGKERYRNTARKSITLVKRYVGRLRRAGLPVIGLGGFSGFGGIIYALAHLGFLWQDGALIDEAHSLASDLPSVLAGDRMLDVLSGSAGCIAALRVLDTVSPNKRLLEVATLCGERLLQFQKQQDVGCAWETGVPSSRPLTGFSHGAAGIAWALFKLAAWSNDVRFRTAAESAVAYERSTFVPKKSNWPDFRKVSASPEETDSEPQFCVAWCHGAAGIALARLDGLPYMDDRQTRDEIDVGLQKTVESGFGMDHCLCHGDFGNLDILTFAEQRIGPPWDQIRKRIAADALARTTAEHSPAALGLLSGLAGIGHTLLRLSCPERVPSVLVLEPPVSTRADN